MEALYKRKTGKCHIKKEQKIMLSKVDSEKKNKERIQWQEKNGELSYFKKMVKQWQKWKNIL